MLSKQEVQVYLNVTDAHTHKLTHTQTLYLPLGAGDFYCSGNDLTNFTKIPEGGVEKMAKAGGDLLR